MQAFKRDFLRCLLIPLAVLVATFGRAAVSGEENVLYVYAGQGAFSDDALRAFQKKYDCRVEIDVFHSNEAMFESVRHGDSGYDVFVSSTDMAEALDAAGLLQPLNKSFLGNLIYLSGEYLAFFPDPELRYHIPYTISVAGIGYNRERVDESLLGSWSVFGNQGFGRSTGMLNDVRYTLGAALKHLGYSLNSTSHQEIAHAGKVLQEWKGSTVTMFSIEEAESALMNGELLFIQVFNGTMARMIRENPGLGFFVPSEGSILNSDSFVIPNDTKCPELAHAFINHMLDPRIARLNMEATGMFIPNIPAQTLLSSAFRNNPTFKVEADIIAKSEAVKDVGEVLDLYDEIWMFVLLSDN